MRYGFGLLELLVVFILVIVLYGMFFSGGDFASKKQMAEKSRIKHQQEVVNDKIYEIEQIKNKKQNIEKTIFEGY